MIDIYSVMYLVLCWCLWTTNCRACWFSFHMIKKTHSAVKCE